MSLAAHCRELADYHGGTDLAERVRSALDIQREQRLALAQAADEIERLTGELAKLQARDASSVG
jgi:antirestriction protein ArdC